METCPLITRRLSRSPHVRHVIRGCFQKPEDTEVLLASDWCLQRYSHESLTELSSPQDFPDGIMELHTFRWCEQLCHEPPLQQGGKDETSEDASPTKYMGQDLVVMLTRTSRLWLLAWCNDRFEKVWEWPFRYATALKKAMDASAYKDSGDIVSCFPGFPYLAVNIKTNNLCKLQLVCPTMDGTPDGSQSSPLPDQEIELFPGDTAHVLVASKSCSSPEKWNLILRMAPTKASYWSMLEFSEWTLTEKVEDATRDRASFELPLPAPALQLLVLPPDRKCSKMYVLLVAPAYCGVCCVPNSGLCLKSLIVSLNGFMAGQPFTDWKMQLDWQGLACDCLRSDTLGWVTCSFRQPGGLRFSSFFLEMSTDPVWTAASETFAIPQALPEKNDSDSQAPHKILMTLSGWFLFAPYMGDPVLVSPFADSAKALGNIAMASKRALRLGAQQYVAESDSAEPESAKSAGPSRGFDESANAMSAEEMELIRGWFESCYTPGSSSEALHEGLMRLTNSRHRMAFFHGRLYLKLHLGVHVRDFAVLKNGDATEAVGISGHGSEGALQFIPTSLKIQPSLVSEPVQLPPVTAMWSLTRSRTENEHALVILSFVDASRALTAGHVMEDVSDAVGIITDEPTVACGQVAAGWIVQITPTRALCCSLDYEMESDAGIKRAAMSGIMAELQSLNMRDAETEAGQLPPAPAPSPPPALHVETSSPETQRPEPCWVPSTGGHISAGACAEDLVAVCQDKTLTFLSCVDAFSPVKRKRSQEGAFVLQPLMNLGLKAAASHIAIQRLSPDSSQSMLPRYLVIVSLHDSSIQMMEVRPDVASYRTVGILHHGQLLGSTDPSSPRSIDDVNPDLPPAESVSIVQVTPQEVDLLVAWREGDVTHHRTGLPDVDFHTVDLFDLGDCVPTVQAVNESEKLYLAAGSNLMCNSYIYLLKFNSISRRFVKQTLVLPETRLAAPILLPPQLGMHELLLVCISKTENMTCRSMRCQNSTESAFGGVEIQSRPLGETPTHIAALDWVGAVAVITIPRRGTSVSDFFKSRCGKLLICTECGRGRKMSFALKGHLKVVAMTVWDPSYPAGNGSEFQGAPKKKWLVIAMGAKIGNWRSEILLLEIWREGKKIQVRSRGELPVRDGVRSMAILRDEDDRERLAIATTESQRLLVMMPDPASGVPWEFPPLVEPFGSNITLHPGQIGTVGLAVTLDNGAVMHFVSADEATATEADLEEPTPAQMQNVLHMTSVSDKNSPISACLNLSAGCDSHEGRLASRRANLLTGDLKGNLCLWGTREPVFIERPPFKPDEKFDRWFGVAETRNIVRIQGQLGSEITAIHGVPQDSDGEEEDTSTSHVVVATSDGQFYLVSSMKAECYPASLLPTLQLVMLRDKSKSGFQSTALQDITEMYCEREKKEIIGSPTSASRNPAISRGPAPVLDGDLLHGFMTLSEDKQKELEVEMSSMHKASPYDDVVDILRQSSLDESSSSTFVV